MTGPYNARNPLVLGAMAGMSLCGLAATAGGRTGARTAVPESVVVCNSGHLGDLVCLLPFLEALRERYPIRRLGLLIGPWGRPVFDGLPLVDELYCASHFTLDRSADGRLAKLKRQRKQRRETVRALRKAGYEQAIDTYGWFGNYAAMLWRAGIPRRAGLASGGGGTFYTDRVSFDPLAPIVDNYARTFAAAGLPVGRPVASYPGFRPDPDVERRCAEFGNGYIVIHLGSGTPTRAWPKASWLDLCRRLARDGSTLVFTGSAAERAYVEPICRAAGGIDLAGALSFRGFATLIQRAAAVVCVDTVAGHLAASFGVKAVVLKNGIQPPTRWAPNHPSARSVMSPTVCSPCSRSGGCKSMTCLNGILALDVDLERVFEKVSAHDQ